MKLENVKLNFTGEVDGRERVEGRRKEHAAGHY
jgi:hypothetical protein